jgi:hypothetical protein
MIAMKGLTKGPILLVVAAVLGAPGGQWFSGHKSKAEIERMTPEQRVQEYCREYVRHGWADSDYVKLVESYIFRDPLTSAPHLTSVIDAYEPADRRLGGKERRERCYAVTELVPEVDANVVRLKASTEGREVIAAIRRLAQRLRAAHFDSSAEDDRRRVEYQMVIESLKELEGTNFCDEAVRNTLKLRYKVSLSQRDMLEFADYLISQDPGYPAWSERELYKDWNELNEAGYRRQYVILKNIEPFYKAYLEFIGKAKPSR